MDKLRKEYGELKEEIKKNIENDKLKIIEGMFENKFNYEVEMNSRIKSSEVFNLSADKSLSAKIGYSHAFTQLVNCLVGRILKDFEYSAMINYLKIKLFLDNIDDEEHICITHENCVDIYEIKDYVKLVLFSGCVGLYEINNGKEWKIL